MSADTIWKYTFDVHDEVTLTLPRHAHILRHVHAESAIRLTVWAEVDPDAPTETRTLVVVGTGNPRGPHRNHDYLGTAVAPPFVWHVYEEVTPTEREEYL